MGSQSARFLNLNPNHNKTVLLPKLSPPAPPTTTLIYLRPHPASVSPLPTLPKLQVTTSGDCHSPAPRLISAYPIRTILIPPSL